MSVLLVEAPLIVLNLLCLLLTIFSAHGSFLVFLSWRSAASLHLISSSYRLYMYSVLYFSVPHLIHWLSIRFQTISTAFRCVLTATRSNQWKCSSSVSKFGFCCILLSVVRVGRRCSVFRVYYLINNDEPLISIVRHLSE